MQQPYSDTNAGLHYDLHLEIDPKTSYAAVSGSIAYQSPLPQLERARFYLHKQFNVQVLEGKRILGYQFETGGESQIPNLPQAGTLDVYFNPPLGSRDTALIQFEYNGYIDLWSPESANVITPEWTELGLYLPWFPLQYDSGSPSELTFTLKVSCPPEYRVSSFGRCLTNDGVCFFNWPHPTTDIVVTVGQNGEHRTFESETSRVHLNANTFGEQAAANLGEDLLWTLERYSGWFGPIRPAEFTLIESPRQIGGGYARRGMVVLAGINERDYLDQREAYLRYLAHEAAHAWWWQAPTDSWEDWLNESFAEYSALLAVRERYGSEIFERFIERKRERVSNAAPVWGFDRSDTATPEKKNAVDRILYDKGPLLLHDLSERIGSQRFLELCRGMLWSGVNETGHLLDLLEELEDNPVRQWMENRLKNSKD
jgi:hypothetical protein